MAQFDPAKYREATASFKLGVMANSRAVHRTLNREPKGKGWVQCKNAPAGVMCKPDKVREAIEHFKKAYEIFPGILALNQMSAGQRAGRMSCLERGKVVGWANR